MHGAPRAGAVLQTEFAEGCGAFSPDGRWIAYCSDESGRFEVYVRSFTDGGAVTTAGKWQVSTTGGAFSRWRRDGKELFFNAPDGKLMAVPVKADSTFEAGIPVALLDMHNLIDDLPYDARPDGQRLGVRGSLDDTPNRVRPRLKEKFRPGDAKCFSRAPKAVDPRGLGTFRPLRRTVCELFQQLDSHVGNKSRFAAG